MDPRTLVHAPEALPDRDGHPRFGRYVGQTGSIDWSRLAEPYARGGLWRYFHHKRWQYVALAHEHYFSGVAVVDVGWTSAAFAYVFDLEQKKEICAWSRDGLPFAGSRIGDAPNQSASFDCLGKRIHFARMSSGYSLSVSSRAFEIDAEINAGSSPMLLAVGPITGGSVHATQKSGRMLARGRLKIGAQTVQLNDMVASFDYSNGLLARTTCWRWASAHDRHIGFNLQQGYFGNHENALWLDDELIPLGAARIEYDAGALLNPWHVETDDGLLMLDFHPMGMRRENRQLGFAASRYVQPVGRFSGWVRASVAAPKRNISNLTGVTEDHFARW